MTKAQQVRHIHQMTVAQFEKQFPDEDSCKQYLKEHRWPDGVVRCPRCGFEAKPHGTMAFNWTCYNCAQGTSYRFSVLVDTIFENTNKDLREWFRVIHLMLVSKKGMSALQIQRYMGFGSYRTAWSMCHKVRAGLASVDFRKLIGYVEVDETFIGGKAKNKHKGPGGRGGIGGGSKGKEIVVGAVTRKGNVVAQVIDDVSSETLERFVRETVGDKVSLISTDEWRGYAHLKHEFPHGFVRHGKDEYVAGAIHTQTIEGFWSLIKRGIVGTFHKVSRKYLPLYVAEFSWRYNNRMNADIFGAAISTC